MSGSHFFQWLSIALSLAAAANAETAADEIAQRLFQRLTGTKIRTTDPRYATLRDKVAAGNLSEAAEIAAADDAFYNSTIFHFFSAKSNRSETADVPLNDFIAMGIANTVQGLPYTNLLTGNFTAVAASITDVPATPTDNQHYERAYNDRVNLARDLQIVTPQRPAAGFPDNAGVLTSRQFLREHAFAGTNRRIVEFTFREFLCTPIKQWRDADPSLSDSVVRRDVSRRPGNDPLRYQRDCRSCHQVLDPLANAFSRHDFPRNERSYSNGVVAKINAGNGYYPGAPAVSSDEFKNFATLNHNQAFGWRGPLEGRGATQFAQMVAKARRFSSCAVEQVFLQLCRRPLKATEAELVNTLADAFEAGAYNLRSLFVKIAALPNCAGEVSP